MKDKCECCGTCCRHGGPPLHVQDNKLVASGILTYDYLVTIRQGEMVLPPMAAEPVAAQTEWIKVQGKSGSWCCRFLDMESNACTIYENRPLSCRILKCWDTSEILAMAGRELLDRFDLIKSDDPLRSLVRLQEDSCPVPDIDNIVVKLKDIGQRDGILKELTDMVVRDLQIRARAVSEFNISLASELFYFGRPLFQILQPLGITVKETPAGIELLYHPQ